MAKYLHTDKNTMLLHTHTQQNTLNVLILHAKQTKLNPSTKLNLIKWRKMDLIHTLHPYDLDFYFYIYYYYRPSFFNISFVRLLLNCGRSTFVCVSRVRVRERGRKRDKWEKRWFLSKETNIIMCNFSFREILTKYFDTQILSKTHLHLSCHLSFSTFLHPTQRICIYVFFFCFLAVIRCQRIFF